jgi:hypothetical protein
MEEPKNKGGRPPLPESERLEQRSIRLKSAHWAKMDAAGGIEWLRALIQRAKVQGWGKK